MSRRALLAVLLALVLGGPLLVLVPRVEAHAVLVRSSPAAQSQLSGSPSSIDLWLSEPLEARFSTFELLASDGTSIPLDGVTVDPADAFHMTGLTRGLEPGLYTVLYRTLSQRDGHEWSGAFAFTILNRDGTVPAGSAYAPALGGSSSPPNIAGRWLTFLGLTLVAGGAPLLRWPRRRPGGADEALARTARRVYSGLLLASLPLLAGGSVLVLLGQLEQLPGAEVSAVLGETRFGTIWLWRALIGLALATVAALGLVAASRRREREAAVILGVAPLLAAGGLLTISLLSHAAAAPGAFWAVASDFIHLALAAAWLGGLATIGALLFVTRRAGAPLRTATLVEVVGPFSTFAAVAVYLLVVTGVLRSLGELSTTPALWESEYGRWLLVKLALITPLLLIALANRRALQAAAEDAAGRLEAARHLRRLLPIEAGVGAAVLLTVAVLGQVPTPRGEVAPAATSGVVAPYNRIEQVDDVNVHLQVTPGTVGDNTLRVHVYSAEGEALPPLDRVRLTFASAGAAGGEQVEATPQGDNVYAASGSFLSLARTWNVRVDVQRAGRDDLRSEFAVPISAAASPTAEERLFGSPAPQLTLNTLWALLAMAGGVGAIVGGRRRRAFRALVQTGGIALVFAAMVLAISGETHQDLGLFPENPIVVDADSISRGQALYEANCVTCHGVQGRGDGPAAATLDPPPSDLRLHVPLHPEGETFVFISKGFAGTAMPAWEDELSEEQRWHLVNFLRTTFDQ